MKAGKSLTVVLIVLLLTACSTREVVKKRAGSTEQRLITYSIEKMINALPEEDFNPYRGKRVELNTHFIIQDELLGYADRMLRLSLQHRFGIDIISSGETSDAIIDIFFDSIGTDADSFGLSIPLVNLSDTSQSTRIDLLALDMYHGVTECHYYIRDLQRDTLIKSDKILARIRTDKVATPIFNFPVSNL